MNWNEKNIYRQNYGDQTYIENRSDLATFVRESNLIERVDDRTCDKVYYNVFLKYYEMMFTKGLSVQDVRKMQMCITAHSMYNEETQYLGELRDEHVVVGIGRRQMCDKTADISRRLQGILKKNHQYMLRGQQGKIDRLDLDKIFENLHVEFEMLHPFIDGNGRVGRLIWNLYRLHAGLPLKIVYEREKHEYYKLFQAAEMEVLIQKTFPKIVNS